MKCQIEKFTVPKEQCAGKGMRVCRKIVRMLDNLVDRFLFLLCILIFLMGGYALFDSYVVYYQAADNDILKFKPGYETEEDVNKEIQGFMAAWLTMDGSDIDHPVMQGDDNSEYLSKDPFGGYSLAALFPADWDGRHDTMNDVAKPTKKYLASLTPEQMDAHKQLLKDFDLASDDFIYAAASGIDRGAEDDFTKAVESLNEQDNGLEM